VILQPRRKTRRLFPGTVFVRTSRSRVPLLWGPIPRPLCQIGRPRVAHARMAYLFTPFPVLQLGKRTSPKSAIALNKLNHAHFIPLRASPPGACRHFGSQNLAGRVLVSTRGLLCWLCPYKADAARWSFLSPPHRFTSNDPVLSGRWVMTTGLPPPGLIVDHQSSGDKSS